MAEIYKVSKNVETLEKLYKKRLESGDYIGALSVVKSIDNISEDKLLVSLKYSETYYYLTQYDKSVESAFKTICELDKFTMQPDYESDDVDDDLYAEAYATLGASFYKVGNVKTASYYFNKQLAFSKQPFYPYFTAFQEFLDDVTDVESNYYLVYPFESADFTALIENAKDVLKTGDYNKVITMLNVIPSSSKFYAEKVSLEALCKYFLKDYNGAIEGFILAVNLDKSNVLTLCNAISILNKLDKVDLVNEYLTILKNATKTTDEEIYKSVLAFCETGEDLLAYDLLLKYLKNNEYDVNALLILGQIYYNLQNYQKAFDTFNKCVEIANTWVARFYRNLANKKLQGVSAEDKIDYSFDITEAQRKKIVKCISKFLKTTANDFSADDEALVYYLSDYAFENEAYNMQSSCVTVLTEINNATSQEYLANLLVKPSVYDQIKSGIVGFLTAEGYEGSKACVFGNLYKYMEFTKVNFDGIGGDLMNEAYALCIAKLVAFENDLTPIRTTAIKYFYLFNEFNFTDIRSLAAVLFELSGIKPIKNRREFAKFFGASLKEIKRIKETFLLVESMHAD